MGLGTTGDVRIARPSVATGMHKTRLINGLLCVPNMVQIWYVPLRSEDFWGDPCN